MFQHLLQYHAGIKCNVLIFISPKSSKYNLVLSGEIFNSGPPRANLTTQKIVEYLNDVFTSLEIESSDVENEVIKKISIIRFLGELCHQFR